MSPDKSDVADILAEILLGQIDLSKVQALTGKPRAECMLFLTRSQ